MPAFYPGPWKQKGRGPAAFLMRSFFGSGGSLTDDLVAGKELRDLDPGVVDAVGTVDRVLAERARELLADRPGSGVLGVRGAHDLAVAHDCVVALQNLNDHRARGHELDELAEEGALPVNRVEGLGLAAVHADALLRDDPEPCAFDNGVHGARDVPFRRVWLDDGEGALEGHAAIRSCKVLGKVARL